MTKVALFAEASSNKKISSRGGVSATYASIEGSCPASCPLRGEGCYAQQGMVAFHTRRLGRGFTNGMRPEAVARAERQAIRDSFNSGDIPQDGVTGGRDLRMHVSGDARTRRSAAILGSAASEWKERGGGDVWTYTHAWRTVPRTHWGDSVSVLASVETAKAAEEAKTQGYSPAIVVAEHPSDKVYRIEGSDVRFIPCLQQTRGVSCTDCRLCFDDAGLRDRNMGIAFAAHGATRKIKRVLTVLGS